MTREELTDLIADIYDKVLELELKNQTMQKELALVQSKLEEIPDDPTEIK